MLTGFRDAIRYVLEETLAGMNEGKDIDTLASEIVLPQEYASLPYLGEYYGCVEWTVRAIFTAYLGWFDGNPTNLHPLPPKERAEKAVLLAGGADGRVAGAEEAVRKGECQWCLELCDLLLTIGVNAEAARRQKAVARPSWPPMKPAPMEGTIIWSVPTNWKIVIRKITESLKSGSPSVVIR